MSYEWGVYMVGLAVNVQVAQVILIIVCIFMTIAIAMNAALSDDEEEPRIKKTLTKTTCGLIVLLTLSMLFPSQDAVRAMVTGCDVDQNQNTEN